MIGRLRPLPIALLVMGTALVVTGCPALLDDDYHRVVAARGGSASVDPDAGRDGGGAGRADAGGSSGFRGSGGQSPSTGDASSNDAALPDARVSGDDAGTCSRCLATEACCDGECVNREENARHCGKCGVGCPGTVCEAASCTNQCAFGFIDCNRNVVDGCEVNAAQDPDHCGNCDTACGFQQTCVQGTCRCPDLTADCDAVASGNPCATDLGSDPENCGKCHQVCGAHSVCSLGKCDCAAGFADCNGEPRDGCEASLSDAATCGSCNLDCGQHSVCVSAGKCACVAEYQDCDPSTPGCETSRDDPAHCGSCTGSCTAPSPVCSGTACVAGCGARTLCEGSCVDTTTDPRNCGACNRTVGANQTCAAGKPVCLPGFASCDSNPLDCEVDTRDDAAHCGTCAVACKPGALCTSGRCGCSPDAPQDCGTACRECCDDTQCSDGDSCTTDRCNAGKCDSSAGCAAGSHCCAGQACYECCVDADCAGKPGTVCSQNRCETETCNPPRLQCGASCVDPTTDPANCNECGKNCGKNRVCTASDCAPDWVPVASAPASFVAREKAAYAAFGAKVFVWGGAGSAGSALADGAWYDTDTDAWSVVSTVGAPSARVLATAVWTGTFLVVWGGGDAAGRTNYASGARFDPSANAWLPMSSGSGASGPSGGPISARRAPDGFWTGSRVLFAGGVDPNGKPLPGVDLYDPQNDTWAHATSKGQPPALLDPAVCFTGSALILQGGQPDGKGQSKHTYLYTPGIDAWTHGADGPTDRYGSLGTWDGSALLVWSGAAGPVLAADGKRYSAASDSWTTVGTTAAPALRVARHREAGFSARVSDGTTLILGGYGASSPPGVGVSTPLTDGGLYSSVTNTWMAVTSWPSGSAHLFGVGVWTGAEFVVWGGRTAASGALGASGERFRP